MFLKALQMRGFKTFADQIEIEFFADARITAIVGPNGCGKSNTLDATRWVLGEDNPRELRVANLSDIIFSGTQNRKPLSMAEVTLVFDNSSGRFPVAFTEVAIKRRTFREGESEFFLNKNPCRLKDIKDFLLDTGLGEGTYSIITQGQVDAILSSKGEERRMVFEEAAGINKYKTRKISAQKKLIAAEQNILRISDLKIEIVEQLITLEEQAKKASLYIETQARVKDIEIGLSKRILSGLIEKKNKLDQELSAIKASSMAQQQTEAQDTIVLRELKDQLRQIETDIDNISLKLEEEKDRLRDVELDRRFLEGETTRNQEKFDALEKEKQHLSEKIQENKKLLRKEQSGGQLSADQFENVFESLYADLEKFAITFSHLLAAFGGKNISLSVGGSKEKEEAYKIKLELFEEELIKIEKEIEKTSFSVQANRSAFDNIKLKIDSNQTKGELVQVLAQKRDQKEELKRKILLCEEKIRLEESAEKKKIGEEAALEIALAKLDAEMNGLLERMFLEYNLSLADILGQPLEIENIGKAKKEVEEGKQKLRGLEPVNLLAVDEFAKAKERASFIEVQLADLNQARESLAGLIVELDQKAEETFVTTMQNLSLVFSETFSTLFSGGEAKITLEEGVSPLEAQIDIQVRPMGRKWLPLTQLSGGERSLSAIAILFSLLKIRPSPFCFMDEVDAALDDANVERFAKMLLNFSSQTQIIVISHNKRTMAIANNIYGITMEEPGVSKVISMKLAEAGV